MVESQVFCGIVGDDSLQNSETVLAILKNDIEHYKKAHPSVTKLHIRSDNAGNNFNP